MSRKRAIALNLVRGAAIFAALACIWVGIDRREPAVVLRKAIRICLECIGVAG